VLFLSARARYCLTLKHSFERHSKASLSGVSIVAGDDGEEMMRLVSRVQQARSGVVALSDAKQSLNLAFDGR
jgi:hypothetical protein